MIKINVGSAAQLHISYMLKFIPWDIWAAVALAATVGLAAIFDPAPAVFVVVYLGLCAYIVVETFRSEPR